MPFVATATYYTKQGKDDAVAAILSEMTSITRQEPGCVCYFANRSRSDPRRFLLYEHYVDEAGYEAHKQGAAFREKILGTVVPMLEERVPELFSLIEPKDQQ